MRSIVLLALLAGLTGCAGLTAQSGDEPGLADVRAKIAMGRCDDGLVAGLGRYKVPELEQEAAYICLQQGEIAAVEKLLENYTTAQQQAYAPSTDYPTSSQPVRPRAVSTQTQKQAPHADYSAYLLALAQQLRFDMAEGDDLARIREGRVAHQRYADFVRSYPESEYRSEVGPRLNALFEEIASSEHRLALQAAEAGDLQTAHARMSYIARYYPHSRVARDANDWLEKHPQTEQDNTAPGSAWKTGP